MKKINSSLFGIFMLLVCIFSVQSIFAVDVPLKKNENGPGTMIISRSMSINSVSINPVSVTLNDTELIVDFSNPVGIAQITVEDQNGAVVYQDVIDTNSTLESVIETGNFDSGKYKVRISYGSTKLTGTFQL
jgi:hypothetical protein